MENLSLRERLAVIWLTWRNLKRNIVTYCEHSKQQAENEIRNKQWSNAAGVGEIAYLPMNAVEDVVESDSDIYLPNHSSVVIEGDGYHMIFHNESNNNKHIYFTIKSEHTREKYYEAPPLFDEGEENG